MPKETTALVLSSAGMEAGFRSPITLELTHDDWLLLEQQLNGFVNGTRASTFSVGLKGLAKYAGQQAAIMEKAGLR